MDCSTCTPPCCSGLPAQGWTRLFVDRIDFRTTARKADRTSCRSRPAGHDGFLGFNGSPAPPTAELYPPGSALRCDRRVIDRRICGASSTPRFTTSISQPVPRPGKLNFMRSAIARRLSARPQCTSVHGFLGSNPQHSDRGQGRWIGRARGVHGSVPAHPDGGVVSAVGRS
jgi:hypothetical protein